MLYIVRINYQKKKCNNNILREAPDNFVIRVRCICPQLFILFSMKKVNYI